jgi:hypothetical protein
VSDTDVIYNHVVEKKKCPYVSPAGLKAKANGKEAIKHLKAKNCPELPALKKQKLKKGDIIKMDDPASAAMAAPTPASAVAASAASPSQPAAPKRARKVTKVTHAEPKVFEEVVPAAPPPAAAASTGGKTKRAPSAYNLFVKEHLKAGKAMTEIGKLWKEKKQA